MIDLEYIGFWALIAFVIFFFSGIIYIMYISLFNAMENANISTCAWAKDKQLIIEKCNKYYNQSK